MRGFGWLVAAVCCAGLLSSCSVFGPLSSAAVLTKKLNEISGVSEGRFFNEWEGGFGPRRFELQVTFESGLDASELGDAVFKVCELSETADAPIKGTFLNFEKGSFEGDTCSLDPSTGVLELVEGLSEFKLEPRNIPNGGNKAPSYVLSVISEAISLPAFRKDVYQVLDLYRRGSADGVIDVVSVYSPDEVPFDDRNYVALEEYPEGDLASLFQAVMTTTDPLVESMRFFDKSTFHRGAPSLRVTTAGQPESVASWLRKIAADYPANLHIEATDSSIANQRDAWLDEVG